MIRFFLCLVSAAALNVSPNHGISKALSDACIPEDKVWRDKTIKKLWALRSDDMKPTSVKAIPVFMNKVCIQLKNEAETPTGSLKHRYAWALFLWALQDGYIMNEHTIVIEASSGNTATSEAYFAQKLNLKFHAVVEYGTSQKKIDKIREYGGNVTIAHANESIIKKSEELERSLPNSFFMNQFANGQVAEDFYFSNGSSNVLNEYILQNGQEAPDWFVHSAGTGGTMTSVARFVRRYALKTKCALADTEHSPFFDWVVHGWFNGSENDITQWKDPGISGIGFNPAIAHQLTYGQTTSLFAPILTRALKVSDLAAIAAMRVLKEDHGIKGGPSTGTNFVAALQVAYTQSVTERGMSTVLTLICDTDDRYFDTYYNDTWLTEQFADRGGIAKMNCYKQAISTVLRGATKNISPFDFLKTNCPESTRPKRYAFNDSLLKIKYSRTRM